MSSSSSKASPRKSNGRRKVTMAKMENQSNLQVTFSKLRVGLFKKASELCILCGVEAAIIIFSPADKVYCFGHPNVEETINKFLNGTSPRQNNNIAVNHELIVESCRNSAIRELNLELVQVESMLTAERNRGEELDKITKTGHMQRMFPLSVGKLNNTQLSVLKKVILELKKNFEGMLHKGIYTPANSQHSFHFYDSLIQKNENLKGYDAAVVGSSIHGAPSFDVNSWSHELGGVTPYFNPQIGISDSIQMAGNNFNDILDPTTIFSSGPSSATASMPSYGTNVINSRGSRLGGLEDDYGNWPTN